MNPRQPLALLALIAALAIAAAGARSAGGSTGLARTALLTDGPVSMQMRCIQTEKPRRGCHRPGRVIGLRLSERLTSPVPASRLSLALLAPPLAVRGNVQVRAGQGMPALAMRLRGVERWDGLAPHRVLVMRDDLQVLGVHAATVPAQVVDLHAVRNRPDERGVRDPVRHLLADVGRLALPVALRVPVALPLPAPGRLIDRHETPDASAQFTGSRLAQHPFIIPYVQDKQP